MAGTFLKQNIELFIITLALFILGVSHIWVNPLLEFNREAIAAGQWWRIFTCNLVHLSVNHMLLNLTGFILATVLFKATIRSLYWYTNIIVCCLAVGFGLWFFDKTVAMYVGLSGALYGVLVFGALLNCRRQMLIAIIVIAYICHRVYLQLSPGFDPANMYDFIGGRVIASSHLFGLMAGAACAFAVAIRLNYPAVLNAIKQKQKAS